MPYGIRIQLYPSIQLRDAGIKHLNIKHRNHSEFFQSICLQFSLVSTNASWLTATSLYSQT